MKKNTIIIIFLLVLSSCGYSPIYSDKDKIDYRVNILGMKGDGMTNDLISKKISRATNNNSTKIYNIEINTIHEKEIISKDTAGAALSYQLKTKTEFSITSEKFNQKIFFEEKINVKKISDVFEQKNYENSIKRSFALSIAEKLIFRLSKI